MRVLGVLLLLLGLGLGAFGLAMETTVPVPGVRAADSRVGEPLRVHNLGLLEQRRTLLSAGGLGIVVGVLLIGFGRRQDRTTSISNPEWLEQQRAAHQAESLRGGSR